MKPSTNSQDPEVVMLLQVHCGSFSDSKLEPLREVKMYTIWLRKTAFTSTVLAIPRAALVHTFFHILSFTCFMTVLQKSDTKSITANQNFFFYFIW